MIAAIALSNTSTIAGPVLALALRTCPRKTGGTPLSCQPQCAVAAPAPFGTRMLSTRSWISTGGSSVALDTT